MASKAALFFFFLVVAIVALEADSSSLGEVRNSRELLRQLDQPFVESYWESYLSFPYDNINCASEIPNEIDESIYGSDLSAVPVGSGSQAGSNVISIAWAEPRPLISGITDCVSSFNCDPLICGLHLYENNGIDAGRIQDLRDDVALLQAQGALVKLAYGGEEYGNIDSVQKIPSLVDSMVDRMVADVAELNLDGVDLAQEVGCGSGNLLCSDQTSIHLYVLESLRAEMPDKIISYTFPAAAFTYPYIDILKYGAQYVDYFNVYRATDLDVEDVLSLGVPPEKIVWGVAIGCNESVTAGDDDETVTVEDATVIAQAVRDGGYAGVATWSIQRDTDHRTDQIGCTQYQTGAPDGSYVEAIYNTLNA